MKMNIERIIELYSKKLESLQPDDPRYDIYTNEIIKLKNIPTSEGISEVTAINQMIDLYKFELSRVNENNPKYELYLHEIERLEGILEEINNQNAEDVQNQSR